ILDGISPCCRQSTAPTLFLALLTLPRLEAIAPKCMTAPSPSTTCRASSSLSAWRRVTAFQMYRTGPDAAASHHPVGTTEHRHSTRARTVWLPDLATGISPPPRQLAS